MDERELVRNLLTEITNSKTSQPIDDLLKQAASQAGTSLQTAAAQLWDLLQWGEVELTPGGLVAKPQGTGSGAVAAPRTALQLSRDERYRREGLAGGVRRPEGRICLVISCIVD
jgi:hypothetical protein